MADDPPVDPDADPAELVERAHAELRATEELPVERGAGRWVGEAQAVAADVADGGLDPAVVRERAARVRELLAEVDGTGNERADARVERARELAAAASDGRAGRGDQSTDE